MNNIKPRANAQMEGTILPLFTVNPNTGARLVYWQGHDTGLVIRPNTVDTIQALCFKTRSALARIVAESRRK